MSNEDLIYRLTKAVYSRLGQGTDEQTIEQLVTEIYREVEPFLSTNGTSFSSFQSSPASASPASQSQEGSSDRMIISVFGVDHPGIVAGVSQILAEAGCSIVDINQTVVQGKFAMVIIANTSRARESASELIARLRREGEKLGVRIYAQREDLFNAMHRIAFRNPQFLLWLNPKSPDVVQYAVHQFVRQRCFAPNVVKNWSSRISKPSPLRRWSRPLWSIHYRRRARRTQRALAQTTMKGNSNQ
jgi:ACT domain-containing protein